MTSDVIEKLFSSGTLVRVMRLFIFSNDQSFDIEDIADRTKSRLSDAKYEVNLLESIGFLKKKSFFKEVKAKSKGSKSYKSKLIKKTSPRKRVNGWVLNDTFQYLPQLRAILVNKQLLDKREMKGKLQKIGKVRLVLASGVFVQEPDARLDLLVVADKVRPAILHDIVRGLEASIGSELRYTLLSPDDFKYRLSVRDRLLRDVFDRPYTEVLNTYKNLNTSMNIST